MKTVVRGKIAEEMAVIADIKVGYSEVGKDLNQCTYKCRSWDRLQSNKLCIEKHTIISAYEDDEADEAE
jgi:hypothetical protein